MVTSNKLPDESVALAVADQSATASATDSSGNLLDVTIGIVYTDSSNNVVASPTNAGSYTATATISDSRYTGSMDPVYLESDIVAVAV